MNDVTVTSVYEAFEYVMDHYYPAGCEDEAIATDTYAVISIQDSHTGGFGIRFCKNRFCRAVLTLIFDDTWKEVEGAVNFNEDMAGQIIDFIEKYRDSAEMLLVHCYAGESRSRAVGLFACRMLGLDDTYLLIEGGSPNKRVYDMLMKVWKARSQQ